MRKIELKEKTVNKISIEVCKPHFAWKYNCLASSAHKLCMSPLPLTQYDGQEIQNHEQLNEIQLIW